MNQQRNERGDNISGVVSNSRIDGQFAVGKGIIQQNDQPSAPPEVTEAERAKLQQILAELRAEVEAQAPPESKAPALERVEELEEAIVAPKPDLTTMEYVRNWFVKKLPALAGQVIGVLVNPIVGKVVAAGGDIAADELRRRFEEE